jgi:protease PrsW
VRFRGLFFAPTGQPRMLLPALIALALTLAVGFALLGVARLARSPEERAAALVRAERRAAAEEIYVALVRESPSVPLALELVDNHRRGVRMRREREARGTAAVDISELREREAFLDEDTLDGVLASLPEDVATVATYWNGVLRGDATEEEEERIEQRADADPPAPYFNHVLARAAMGRGELANAAARYEREGLAFQRAADLDLAASLWTHLEAWENVEALLARADVRALVEPSTMYDFAVHQRDWRSAAKWLALTAAPRVVPSSLAMAAIAALAWGFFCARLGKLGERPLRKTLLYVAAFVLGVISIAPTIVLIAVQEATLNLVETGDPARDILFFVFGVGLREEAAKLLLFLPLLPFLRRGGDRLDVLVCGALVGLGFAAEENLGYLARGDVGTGLGRFLTANFFHMAMTGILAHALYDFVSDTERHGADFTRATLLVVGLHGAYDFLLSHDEYGGGYLAMAVFVLLARQFLAAASDVRRRVGRGLTLLHAFLLAVAVVTGATLVYAIDAVGVAAAVPILSMGLLGEAIIVFVFVQTLRRM